MTALDNWVKMKEEQGFKVRIHIAHQSYWWGCAWITHPKDNQEIAHLVSGKHYSPFGVLSEMEMLARDTVA